MPANHEVFSKTDYVKAHSFNLIQAEKTNCEVEHVKNVGKINSEFYYKKFPWQVGGLRHRRDEDVVCKYCKWYYNIYFWQSIKRLITFNLLSST